MAIAITKHETPVRQSDHPHFQKKTKPEPKAVYDYQSLNEPMSQDEYASISDFYDAMLKAGKEATENRRPTIELFEHLKIDLRKESLGRRSWRDMTPEEKERCCTHQSGNLRVSVRAGLVRWFPMYCHDCKKCITMLANEQKEKFNQATAKCKKDCPNGDWRKVIPKDKKEADALKKKISRNENGRYMQKESTNNSDEDEIYVWTENESYGEPADTNSIDWEAAIKKNKKTKRQVSYGKGARPDKVSMPKPETEKVLIPQIIVHESQQNKVEKAMEVTFPLKYAESLSDVQNMMLEWTINIVRQLQADGVEVRAIHDQYLQLVPDEEIQEWNDYVNRMSLRRRTDL